jgi:hypothetical protein
MLARRRGYGDDEDPRYFPKLYSQIGILQPAFSILIFQASAVTELITIEMREDMDHTDEVTIKRQCGAIAMGSAGRRS